MKNKMMSKAISVLLALMMVFCVIPMSALADTHTANTLIYDANGGEGAPVSGNSDTADIVIDSTVPTRTGHDFVGWNTAADGNGTTYSAGDTYTFAEDTGAGGCVATLYAKWEIKEYDVTFIVDGKVFSTTDVKYGEDVELPEIPKKAGYDETAPTWDNDGKNITEDTVITAQYTVNGYEDVLAIYNAITKVKTALEGTSIDELKTATEEFVNIADSIEEMTDEQGEELLKLTGLSEEDFVVEILTVAVNSGVIVGASDVYDAYIATPNAKTAYDFVELYNGIFNDSEYVDEELRALTKKFFPNIDEVYTDASNNLPSPEASGVYEAYNELILYFEFGYLDGLKETLEFYKDAIDNIDNLTEEQKNELSVLMELTPKEAIEKVLSTVQDSKVLAEIYDAYNAFIESNNEKTARALVEKYDALSSDKELIALLRDSIYDIDEVYAEAVKMVPVSENPPSNTESNDNDKTNKTDNSAVKKPTASKTDKSEKAQTTKKDVSKTSPKTGDNSADVWVILTLLSAAMVMALTVYNKKIKSTK